MATTDDQIRDLVAAGIQVHVSGRQRWQVAVHNGHVDIVGEPDSSAITCALLTLARSVPGVTGVRLFCGQSAEQWRRPHQVRTADRPGRRAEGLR